MLDYKGCIGSVEVDFKNNLLVGRVLGIQDVVNYEGSTVAEVAQAFRDSVDDYLEFCQTLGKEPEKSYSGKFLFRTTPEHHRLIAIAAVKEGVSVNTWVKSAIDAQLAAQDRI